MRGSVAVNTAIAGRMRSASSTSIANWPVARRRAASKASALQSIARERAAPTSTATAQRARLPRPEARPTDAGREASDDAFRPPSPPKLDASSCRVEECCNGVGDDCDGRLDREDRDCLGAVCDDGDLCTQGDGCDGALRRLAHRLLVDRMPRARATAPCSAPRRRGPVSALTTAAHARRTSADPGCASTRHAPTALAAGERHDAARVRAGTCGATRSTAAFAALNARAGGA